MTKTAEKFIFTLDYELDLLRFIVTDTNGIKALKLVDPLYFVSLHHGIIADCLKKYHKKKRRIPGATILKEELLDLFKTREYISALTREDKEGLMSLIPTLYKPVRDGDEILERCARWASYTELKGEVEGVNLLDFGHYSEFSNKVMKAINIGVTKEKKTGTYLLKDITERQFNRQDSNPIQPTPFAQINNLTNAGGYVRGSTIVILDKAKASKTMTLANIARGYLRMGWPVFFADLENGEDELSLRIEQAMTGYDKREVLSGDHDARIQKIMRRYYRLGGDIYIKRFPALSNIWDFQGEIDRLYREEGRRFKIMVVDYAALMASTTKKDGDFERISDVYLDLSNFALTNDIIHTWTANHIVRAAEKRTPTKYHETDIAKCIDIIRHVQAIFGLNRNDWELENDIMRMELVVQRDGRPFGRALFHSEPDIQRLKEFSSREIREYEAQAGESLQELNSEYKGDA